MEAAADFEEGANDNENLAVAGCFWNCCLEPAAEELPFSDGSRQGLD